MRARPAGRSSNAGRGAGSRYTTARRRSIGPCRCADRSDTRGRSAGRAIAPERHTAANHARVARHARRGPGRHDGHDKEAAGHHGVRTRTAPARRGSRARPRGRASRQLCCQPRRSSIRRLARNVTAASARSAAASQAVGRLPSSVPRIFPNAEPLDAHGSLPAWVKTMPHLDKARRRRQAGRGLGRRDEGQREDRAQPLSPDEPAGRRRTQRPTPTSDWLDGPLRSSGQRGPARRGRSTALAAPDTPAVTPAGRLTARRPDHCRPAVVSAADGAAGGPGDQAPAASIHGRAPVAFDARVPSGRRHERQAGALGRAADGESWAASRGRACAAGRPPWPAGRPGEGTSGTDRRGAGQAAGCRARRRAARTRR